MTRFIRKTILLAPLLFLVSCGPVSSSKEGTSSSAASVSSSLMDSQSQVSGSTATSSSSSPSSSTNSSSSTDPNLERYFDALLADTPLTLVRRLVTVTKGTTVFKTVSHRQEIDLVNSVERLYENKTVVAGFEDKSSEK